MNKKSALAAAGGLAASFVAGMGAVSVGWGVGTPSAAAPSSTSASAPTAKAVKPIVKHRTIVVHKKAPANKAAPSMGTPQTVVLAPAAPAPPPPAVAHTSGSTASGGDDGSEHGDD